MVYVLSGKMMARHLAWVHWTLGSLRHLRAFSSLRAFPAPTCACPCPVPPAPVAQAQAVQGRGGKVQASSLRGLGLVPVK